MNWHRGNPTIFLRCRTELTEYLVGFRESPHFVFAEDQLAVNFYIEDTAAACNELRVGSGLFFDLGRQTGGTGKVVSFIAVSDRNRHWFLLNKEPVEKENLC